VSLQRLLQVLLVFQQPCVTGLLVVIHLGPGARQPFGVGLLFDGLGERGRSAAIDAAFRETIGNPLLDHLAGGAELVANDGGLAHEGVEHDVGVALLVAEITAEHLGGGLELAVDAAVALPQA
jgi:hypothetical protein